MRHRSLAKYVVCFFLLIAVPVGYAVEGSPGKSGLITGEPGKIVYPDGSPGETSTMERSYEIAPPFIPHDVSDLELSRSTNDCFDCHSEGVEVDEGHTATMIPPTHYYNASTGEQEDEVLGIRYNCLQCHVQQATAELNLR